MSVFKKVVAFVVRMWVLYMTDWLLGGVTATVAYFIGYHGVLIYAYEATVFLAVLLVQSRLTRSFVRAFDLFPAQRTGAQQKHVDFVMGCFVPVNGAQKLGPRISEKFQKWGAQRLASSQDIGLAAGLAKSVTRWAVFVASAFVAGSYLLMSYRYAKTRDQGGSFWRDARLAACVFSSRFTVTYAVLAPATVRALWSVW